MIILIVNYYEIGLRIRTRRKEMRLKQNELAELADLSNNYLSNIENGRSIPSIEVLVRICGVLKITPDYLLLGVLRPNNVPLNIINNLQLCSETSLEIMSEIVSAFVKHDTSTNKKDV